MGVSVSSPTYLQTDTPNPLRVAGTSDAVDSVQVRLERSDGTVWDGAGFVDDATMFTPVADEQNALYADVDIRPFDRFFQTGNERFTIEAGLVFTDSATGVAQYFAGLWISGGVILFAAYVTTAGEPALQIRQSNGTDVFLSASSAHTDGDYWEIRFVVDRDDSQIWERLNGGAWTRLTLTSNPHASTESWGQDAHPSGSDMSAVQFTFGNLRPDWVTGELSDGSGSYLTITAHDGTRIVDLDVTRDANADPDDAGLYLPGSSGEWASCPGDGDHFNFTGDVQIEWYGKMAVSPPASAQALAGKWLTPSDKNYLVQVDSAGKVVFFWSADGSTQNSRTSTDAASPGANGIKATMVASTGQVNLYESFDDGATWSELGAAPSAFGATSLHFGSAPFGVGAYNNGSASNLAGTTDRVVLRNGIDGTIVANPDFAAQATGATSFNDTAPTANPWNVNGSVASITGNSVAPIIDANGETWTRSGGTIERRRADNYFTAFGVSDWYWDSPSGLYPIKHTVFARAILAAAVDSTDFSVFTPVDAFLLAAGALGDRYARRGTGLYLWATSIADPANPTYAELAAAVNITGDVRTVDGLDANFEPIPLERLTTPHGLAIVGAKPPLAPTLLMYDRLDDTSPFRDLFTAGSEGYLVLLPEGSPVAGDRCRVLPCRSGGNTDLWTVENEAAMFAVSLMLSDPAHETTVNP